MRTTEILYPKCKVCGGAITFTHIKGEEIDSCADCNEKMLHELIKLHFKRRRNGEPRHN